MRAVTASAILVVLFGCGGMQRYAGIDPSTPSSVTIPIGAPTSDAVATLQHRATRGAYTVSATSPGLVTVGPVTIKEDHNVRMTFFVSVVGDSANVRGTITDPFRSIKDQPIQSGAGGRAAWGWRELTRLADALKTK